MTDSHRPTEYTELTEDQMLRINRLCDQFESEWKAGQHPSIETTLQKLPPADRTAALAELLPLEIEYRRRDGTELRFDEYATRFPSLDRTWLAGLL
ncbi:MAG: hypothetical protein KDA68_23255, partial [Planctomycetaceae bacterium]|nr:hypothetical protein [Planctomycetaceae bacterium]